MFSRRFNRGDIRFWGDNYSDLIDTNTQIRMSSNYMDEANRAAFRAIMFNHASKENVYSLYSYDYYYDGKYVKYITDSMKNIPSKNSLTVFFVNCIHDETKVLDQTDNDIVDLLAMKRIRNIEDYIRAKTKWEMRFLQDEVNDRTLIIVPNPSIERGHLIFAFLTRYFPNLFKNKPITEKEKRMILSFSNAKPLEFIESVEQLSIEYDMQTVLLEQQVGQFRRSSLEKMISNVNSQITTRRQEMNRFLEGYNNACEQMYKLTIQLKGLCSTKEETGNDDELVDFFKTHKNFHFIGIEDEKLSFYVETFVDLFNPDAIGTYMRSGAVYNQAPQFNKDDVKLLIEAIFSEDPIMHIGTCAAYKVGLGGSVAGLSSYNYGFSTLQKCIPNTHVDRFACLGSHGPIIAELLGKGELVSALEQCGASAASINIDEFNPTFGPFLRELFSSSEKVIEVMETKERMNVTEAIKWLKERMNKE